MNIDTISITTILYIDFNCLYEHLFSHLDITGCHQSAPIYFYKVKKTFILSFHENMNNLNEFFFKTIVLRLIYQHSNTVAIKYKCEKFTYT